MRTVQKLWEALFYAFFQQGRLVKQHAPGCGHPTESPLFIIGPGL